MRKQRGLSLWSLLAVSALVIVVVLLGFKLFPHYAEYLSVKKALTAIARDPESTGSTRDVQAAFARRATIDNIKAVEGRDLEITKQGDRVMISAVWSVKVPLFYNVSACLDFEATSD